MTAGMRGSVQLNKYPQRTHTLRGEGEERKNPPKNDRCELEDGKRVNRCRLRPEEGNEKKQSKRLGGFRGAVERESVSQYLFARV